MNETFITNAIESDRYLKATRLVDQFESEMKRDLKNRCKAVIEDNSALFPNDPSFSSNIFDNNSSLGTIRMEVPMARKSGQGEDSDTLKFYIAIEWSEPEERGLTEPSDKTLCVALYKIRPNPRDDYDKVARKTKQEDEWTIRCADDINDTDRGVFFIPVTDGRELDDALTELCLHFSKHGDEFGVPQS